jgi:hypothetical protein
MFWVRSDARVADFERAHPACFNEAKAAYSVGSEKIVDNLTVCLIPGEWACRQVQAMFSSLRHETKQR